MAFFVVASLAITMHRNTKMPCVKVKIASEVTFQTFQCDSGTQFCCDEGCCQKPRPTGFFAEIPAAVWVMVPIVSGILIALLIVCIYKKCCGGEKYSYRTREPLFGDNSNNVVISQHQEIDNTPLVALRSSNEVPYRTREPRSEHTAGYLELNLNQDQVQEVDNTLQLTPPPSYEASSRREPLPEYNASVLNQNQVQEMDNTSHLTPPPSYEAVVNLKDKSATKNK